MTLKMPQIILRNRKKEQNVHNCPICGEKTEGSYSEGGIHFDICEECYREKYQEERRKKNGNRKLGL